MTWLRLLGLLARKSNMEIKANYLKRLKKLDKEEGIIFKDIKELKRILSTKSKDF